MEHANTDTVPESAEYRCTGCGDAQEFEGGDDFTICEMCGDEAAGWEAVPSEAASEGVEESDLA